MTSSTTFSEKISFPPIYVIHGVAGYEDREDRLKRDLAAREMDFEFVTEFKDPVQNENLICKYFREDSLNPLTKGKLYCTLVHILAYEKIVSRKQKYALIFENDVYFLNNFAKGFERVMAEARTLPAGFIISLENSTLRFPHWRKIKKEKVLYEAEFGRCAGAYLIDLRGAEKIMEKVNANGFSKVIDWWHNDLVKEGVVKMYWAQPPLTEQGSFNGKLSSSIALRDKGNLRSLRWRLQKFIKMYVTRWFRSP